MSKDTEPLRGTKTFRSSTFHILSIFPLLLHSLLHLLLNEIQTPNMTFTVFHSLILTFPLSLASHHSHPPTCLQPAGLTPAAAPFSLFWRMQHSSQGLVHWFSAGNPFLIARVCQNPSPRPGWNVTSSVQLSPPLLPPSPASSLHPFFPLCLYSSSPSHALLWWAVHVSVSPSMWAFCENTPCLAQLCILPD